MNLYKLYIENTEGPEAVAKELQSHGFSSCTIIPAWGCWRGSAEDSLIVEIITFAGHDCVTAVVQALGRRFNQEAILLACISTTSELVEIIQWTDQNKTGACAESQRDTTAPTERSPAPPALNT